MMYKSGIHLEAQHEKDDSEYKKEEDIIKCVRKYSHVGQLSYCCHGVMICDNTFLSKLTVYALIDINDTRKV